MSLTAWNSLFEIKWMRVHEFQQYRESDVVGQASVLPLVQVSDNLG